MGWGVGMANEAITKMANEWDGKRGNQQRWQTRQTTMNQQCFSFTTNQHQQQPQKQSAEQGRRPM
jgi:hypothetical protein